MALAAGPKDRNAPPPDLDGLPTDPSDRAIAFLARAGINVYAWQEPILRDLVRPDRPRVAYVQCPRKTGKTRLSAMLGLCELVLRPDPRHIYAVSDSERNLHSVLWLELLSLINGSPLLEGTLHTYQAKIENPHTGSFLELRPGSYKSAQGVNPHLVLADETHLIKPEVFHGWQMATAARDDPLLFAVTTPGYELAGPAFDLYETAKAGTDPELYSVIYEPQNPGCDLDDEEAWRQANPILAEPNAAAFLDGLRYDVKRLPENEFRRFRLGQWTSTRESWLPHGAWAACATDRKLKPGEEIWIGYDGSYSNDSTAIVGATKDGFVDVIGHWAKPTVANAGWRIDIATVENALREACRTYRVIELAADPYRWSRSLQILAQEGLPVVEYPQSPSRMIASTARFADAVLDRQLSHSGARGLAAHVANCAVKVTPNGIMVQKEHRDSPRKIDLAVAAIMAFDRATRARERAPVEVMWLG